MTRAPTYPIHRNRRNSISIRFSVRSIRFSRCGPGPVGPRPPASLALGGKEIHYPPRGAESRGSSRSTGPPQPGGGGNWRGPDKEEGRPAGRPEAGGPGGAARGAQRGGQGSKGGARKARPRAGAGPGAGARAPARAGEPACMPEYAVEAPRKRRKAPGPTRGLKEGPPEGGPYGARKRPARARLPILPQPGAAVLSATAGLTAEFGTGSGDPRLHGLARAGRSSCGTLAAAWRPIGRSDRAGCAIGIYE